MTVHVIQFTKLDDQVKKLVEILQAYKEQWSSDGEELYTHDFDAEITSLNNFKTDFEQYLNNLPDVDYDEILANDDIFGNEYSPPYEYAEITYTSYNKFNKIRLLGSDGLNKKRFYIENVEHNFSPNTISLITNVREIIRDPFNLNEFLDLCGKPYKEVDEYVRRSKQNKTRYTWQHVAKNYFIPQAKTAKTSDLKEEELDKLKQKYKKKTLTPDELLKRNKEIFANKQALLEKAKKDKEKEKNAAEQLKKELEKQKKERDLKARENAIGKFVDKFSFACILKEAIECVAPKNISCDALFKDLSVEQIFDRLSAIFPRGSDTFRELEKLVEENLFGNIGVLRKQIADKKGLIEAQKNTLGCLVCEEPSSASPSVSEISAIIALNEEELTKLEQELRDEEARVANDLALSQRQNSLLRTGGNLFAVISSPETDEEKAGIVTISNRVISVIDTIIPLEDLCSLLLQALTGNFDLSNLKFPELRPINDLFAGFSAEISQAFILLILQIVLMLLESIINEALNCDRLDDLIASSLSPENSDKAKNTGIYGDLASIFGGKAPNTSEIIDKNFEVFKERVKPAFENISTIKYENRDSNVSIRQGISRETVSAIIEGKEQQQTTVKEQINETLNSIQSNRKGVLDLLFSQDINDIGKWQIDFSGEKFEIQKGTRILDISNIDKSINSFIKEGAQNIPENLLTPNVADLLKKQAETSVEVLEPGTVSQVQQYSDQQLREEVSGLFSDVVSLSSPTEVVRLLSGKATGETLSFVSEIIKNRTPLLSSVFNNKNSISNLFKQIGISSGLGSIMDNLDILANTTQAQRKVVPPKLCAPFDNTETFKKALMSRTVPKETADKIFENIKNEKIKKYNELIDALIQITAGNIPEKINADPRIKLVNEIKNNIFEPAANLVEDSVNREEEKKSKTSVQDFIRQAMNDKVSQSPIYQDMLENTLSSIFEPIRETFDKDISNLVDGNSDLKQVKKEIKRTITVSSGSITGKVINPEFKQLLTAGLVPIVKDPSAQLPKYATMVSRDILEVNDEGDLDDLRVTGNPNKDFLSPNWSLKRFGQDIFSLGFENKERVELPVLTTTNKRVVGDTFKEYLKEGLTKNLQVTIKEQQFSISINDVKSPNSSLPEFSKNSQLTNILDSYSSLKDEINKNIPKWSIMFNETKDNLKETTDISIKTTGLSVNPIKGFENFYTSFEEKRKSFIIKPYDRNLISQEYGGSSYPLKSRAEVFQQLIYDKIKTFVEQTSGFETVVKKNALIKQEKLIKSITSMIVEKFINTRLFKQTSIGIPDSDQKLVFLELFNFTREPTDKEKACNFDPHVMGFQGLYKKFKDLYDNEPEVQGNQRSRVGNATYKIMTDVVVRLLVVEFVMKTLPIFDSFLYSKDLSNIPMLNEMLTNHVRQEMDSMGILDSFKREFKKQISEQPESEAQLQSPNNVIQEDCRDVSSIEEIISSSSTIVEQVRNKCKEEEQLTESELLQRNQELKRPVSEQEYNSKLNEKIAEQMEQVLDKLSRIFYIPDTQREQMSIKKLFLEAIPVYDLQDTQNTNIFTKKNIIKQNEYVLKFDQETQTKLRNFNNESADLSVREKLAKFYKEVKLQQDNISWELKETSTEQEERLVNEGDLIFQEYVRLGSLTQRLSKRQDLQIYANRTISLNEFTNFIIQNQKKSPLKIYDCDDVQNGIFTEPPRYGIKLNFVYKVENFINRDLLDLGTIYDVINNDFLVVDGARTYTMATISQEEVELKSSLSFEEIRKINIEENNKKNIFYPILKQKVLASKEFSTLFEYCIPVKEIVGISLLHTYFVNNNEKNKYMFKPTKNKIKAIFDVLDNIGNNANSSKTLADVRKKQKQERDNEGNPAGPIDFEALSMFLKTPIHILRSLAVMVDPNVFIADKIVAGAAIAGALTGQKIYIPYSAASVALLPFPLFNGVAPPIPPLTAYNIAMPVGPVFLVLEFLLWLLSWFKNLASDPSSQTLADVFEAFGIQPTQFECNDQEEIPEGTVPLDFASFEYMVEQIKKVCSQ